MRRVEEPEAATFVMHVSKARMSNIMSQVRERYPTFSDAIRDLDDSLSMVALYDCLPTDQKNEIRGDVVQESARLVHEFFLYVIQTKSLKKCFASIKGYYFQADIQGETVTWLVPHKYTQELPAEVDFRVLAI